MTKAKMVLAALTATISCAAHAGPATVVSDFATGADGWVTADLLGFSGPLVPAWDPAGFIATHDLHKWNVFSAPAKFLGDQSAYAGGTMSLRLSVDMHDPGTAWPVVVMTDGLRFLASAPYANPAPDFTVFTYALGPGVWQTSAGEHLGAADFAVFLGALKGIYVNADFRTDGNDYARLDDFRIAAAVPEPESYALLMAGLGVLGALRSRRRRS